MTLLIVGAGKIGKAVKLLLETQMQGAVKMVDKLEEVPSDLSYDAVFACVPYYACPAIAEWALQEKVHYIDFTEDVKTRQQVREISYEDQDLAFVSGTGLAPGYINTIAANLMVKDARAESVTMMCGALPQNPGYKISWSPEGIAREYQEPCEIKSDGHVVYAGALSKHFTGLLHPDWPVLEGFYTSGGAGTCPQTLSANSVEYFTLRYPGHLAEIKELLKGDKEDAQRLVDRYGYLGTEPDVVYIQVNVKFQDGSERTHCEKILPYKGLTALQYATALGALLALHSIIYKQERGFLRHEWL